jgi:hypothetical protein
MTTLGECPPGLFLFGQSLALKSEYKTESSSHPGFWQSDAYLVESGEYFWGGTADPREREKLMVSPLDPYRCKRCGEVFLGDPDAA